MWTSAARPEELAARDLALFTAAVALLAIFADAALGHGLTWENDPYWTYWVTKTFLIATVFGLGTAWLGIGPGRGAVITAAHTLVLTVYYWTFSPIGLPSSPEWLDLEHTWVTGLPIHFGVIYLGYLGALFVWRRRGRAPELTVKRLGTETLAASVAIVVVAGGLSSLALWEFPGVTWFLVRLLLTFPLLLFWWSFVGRDPVASASGALVVALAWATYGQFLGPSGLPDLPLRVFAETPPSATVEWLGYRELWLVAFPLVLVGCAAVLLAWPAIAAARAPSRHELTPALLVLAVTLVPVVLGAATGAGDAASVTLRAGGQASIEQGPLGQGPFVEGTGSISVTGEDAGARVTPLPPHDRLSVKATVSSPSGTYVVSADRPLVEDPLGRHTTWWGVGVDVWHHGRTGIGTSLVPELRSEAAVFGVGSIHSRGRELASFVPVHVMTTDDGLELLVGDSEVPVSGLPDGHLRAMWPEYTKDISTARTARYVIGSVVLVGLLVLALVATRRYEPDPRAA